MSVTKDTLLIHVESKTYPLTLAALKLRHTNISFGQEVDEQLLTHLGYAVVQPGLAPVGDVVTEGEPLLMANGTYLQNFEARAYNEQELAEQLASARAGKLQDIEQARLDAISIGAPMRFAGRDDVLHAQMRDGDRANILGLRAHAEVLQQQGVSDAVVPFRTYEDVTVMLTPAQTITMAWAVFGSYQQVMSTSWSLKDAVAAAATPAAVEAVEVSFEQEPTVVN